MRNMVWLYTDDTKKEIYYDYRKQGFYWNVPDNQQVVETYGPLCGLLLVAALRNVKFSMAEWRNQLIVFLLWQVLYIIAFWIDGKRDAGTLRPINISASEISEHLAVIRKQNIRFTITAWVCIIATAFSLSGWVALKKSDWMVWSAIFEGLSLVFICWKKVFHVRKALRLIFNEP